MQPRMRNPVLLALAVVGIGLGVYGAGCKWSSQRTLRAPATAPTSRIMLTAEDAKHIALLALTKGEPTLLPSTISCTPVTTEYPGVTKGRPVYAVIIDGEITVGPRRVGYMVPVVVDATTGELVTPGPHPLGSAAAGAQPKVSNP